jgi:hypothetical protein
MTNNIFVLIRCMKCSTVKAVPQQQWANGNTFTCVCDRFNQGKFETLAKCNTRYF